MAFRWVVGVGWPSGWSIPEAGRDGQDDEVGGCHSPRAGGVCIFYAPTYPQLLGRLFAFLFFIFFW